MGNAITIESELECEMGAEPFLMISDRPFITLEFMPAASIEAANPMPYFGQCSIWPTMTFGTVTECIPMIVMPQFMIGSLITTWDGVKACVEHDMYACALGPIEVQGGQYDIG
jgi:hypothetical protein